MRRAWQSAVVRKGGFCMEDMIKRIIDMDRKAQEITDAARKEKIEAEKDIASKAQALREEYLARARRRIQINAETDRTLFEQKWRRREKYYEEQAERLESLYAAHHDEWVDAIFHNVIASS